MKASIPLIYYTGDPKTQSSHEEKLPSPNTNKLTDPEHYVAAPELAAAVNVAIELGMPLLLTGDPGTGKSCLADAVAHAFGFNKDKDGKGRAMRFVVKSDTTAQDLFYRFDTLGRFHASQHEKESREPREFITYQALGLALLRAKGPLPELKTLMRDDDWEQLQKNPGKPQRNVVLIDEIDKAPREVPNDLLAEIESLSFKIPELFHHQEITLDDSEQAFRPIVIITSNSERELPSAFLRRCIYFHVELPPYRSDVPKPAKGEPQSVTLEQIVDERLGERNKIPGDFLGSAIALFRVFRESDLEQKPSTAELLQWLLYLSKRLEQLRVSHVKDHPELAASLGVLLKPHGQGDRDRIMQLFDQWRQAQKK